MSIQILKTQYTNTGYKCCQASDYNEPATFSGSGHFFKFKNRTYRIHTLQKGVQVFEFNLCVNNEIKHSILCNI